MKSILKSNLDEAVVITVGNRKGGVGKTSNTILLSYCLAARGIKTLVVDLDPQSNATKSLILTKSNHDPDGIMTGVQEGKIDGLEVFIMENLYLLPSFIDFEDFPKFLFQNTSSQKEEDFFIRDLLEPLKKKFDIILIDVPPMSGEITRNAVVSSSFVLISLQTQERSLTGAEDYIRELDRLNAAYSLDLIVLGFIPVLLKNGGSVDSYIMQVAKDSFGEHNIIHTVIPQMERINRFEINGITQRDRHDEKVISKYNELTDEFLERLNYYLAIKAGENDE